MREVIINKTPSGAYIFESINPVTKDELFRKFYIDKNDNLFITRFNDRKEFEFFLDGDEGKNLELIEVENDQLNIVTHIGTILEDWRRKKDHRFREEDLLAIGIE